MGANEKVEATFHPGKALSTWSDKAMFRSETHDATTGPRVHLLAAPADPLGQIAACSKMYLGEVVRDLSEVTHAERVHYMEEMKKTKLKMPLEAVTFHFMIENVTRAFTHQLVRQRTAAYAQESMRFAVVEDMNDAVALPPSISKFNDPAIREESLGAKALNRYPRDETERQFWVWWDAVDRMGGAYMNLVESGMPAEDARGLMPTNIVTRVNYITNLRGLLDHAGNRLCTQAQFEWRLVFAQIAKALRDYNPAGAQAKSFRLVGGEGNEELAMTAEYIGSGAGWQYEAIASLLQPVCYQTGSCAFKADFDRACSIRERVNASEKVGRKHEGSGGSDWGKTWLGMPSGDPHEVRIKDGVVYNEDGSVKIIDPIHPSEWLADPAAARVKS